MNLHERAELELLDAIGKLAGKLAAQLNDYPNNRPNEQYKENVLASENELMKRAQELMAIENIKFTNFGNDEADTISCSVELAAWLRFIRDQLNASQPNFDSVLTCSDFKSLMLSLYGTRMPIGDTLGREEQKRANLVKWQSHKKADMDPKVGHAGEALAKNREEIASKMTAISRLKQQEWAAEWQPPPEWSPHTETDSAASNQHTPAA